MKILGFLLQKEFIQISRDKTFLSLVVIICVVQLLVLPRAAKIDLKKIPIGVVDHDKSTTSGNLLRRFVASDLFVIRCYSDSYTEALGAVERDEAKCIVQIPRGFEKELMSGRPGKMMLELDAVNGVRAGISSFYALQIIKHYMNERRAALGIREGFPEVSGEKLRAQQDAASRDPCALVIPTEEDMGRVPIEQIRMEPNYRYNPDMDSKLFRIPAIIAMLMALIGCILAAMNIVTEKENGTIEQMNVSPVRKSLFILSKLIPFWVIGLGILTLSLVVVRVMYGVVPAGSYLSVYFYSFLFLVAFVGFGMLLSTFCSTQQQAMLLCFFFLMITCLLCGMWTPIRSMPGWARLIADINPMRYYVEAMRLIFAFGSGLKDILPHILAMLAFIVVFNGWAIWNYRKN